MMRVQRNRKDRKSKVVIEDLKRLPRCREEFQSIGFLSSVDCLPWANVVWKLGHHRVIFGLIQEFELGLVGYGLSGSKGLNIAHNFLLKLWI